MPRKRIKRLSGGFYWGQGVGVEPGFHMDTYSVLSAKISSVKTADCVDDWVLECINLSYMSFFGRVPHFDCGLHADAPVNPLHGSMNMDYETTFYPTDANTKQSGKMPFCRLFHSPAVAISCSESGDCSFYYRMPHARPSNSVPPFIQRASQGHGSWLAFIFFKFKPPLHFHSVWHIRIIRNLIQAYFCQALKTKGE